MFCIVAVATLLLFVLKIKWRVKIWAQCEAFLKRSREIKEHFVCGIHKKVQSVLILNNPFRNYAILCHRYSSIVDIGLCIQSIKIYSYTIIKHTYTYKSVSKYFYNVYDIYFNVYVPIVVSTVVAK